MWPSWKRCWLANVSARALRSASGCSDVLSLYWNCVKITCNTKQGSSPSPAPAQYKDNDDNDDDDDKEEAEEEHENEGINVRERERERDRERERMAGR